MKVIVVMIMKNFTKKYNKIIKGLYKVKCLLCLDQEIKIMNFLIDVEKQWKNHF